MHKTELFPYNFSFIFWFIPFEAIIGIKTAPGDHEPIFLRKWVQFYVGAILSEPILQLEVFRSAVNTYLAFDPFS